MRLGILKKIHIRSGAYAYGLGYIYKFSKEVFFYLNVPCIAHYYVLQLTIKCNHFQLSWHTKLEIREAGTLCTSAAPDSVRFSCARFAQSLVWSVLFCRPLLDFFVLFLSLYLSNCSIRLLLRYLQLFLRSSQTWSNVEGTNEYLTYDNI